MQRNLISIWIKSLILLIFIMIILGGYTRLSHSGLSIVEWAPVSGAIPPMSEVSWDIEFSKYKQSPEYQKINYGISVDEFKQIFMVEYSHRLLGRIIGLIFLLPLIYFILTKKISSKDIKYYIVILTLIALQGGIGWFMVKSGLINQPNVSQYRLALHLVMACIILILLAWKMNDGETIKSRHGYWTLFLVLVQITSGAFVAGLKAGLIYNSFPLMNGEFLPSGLLIMKPWYINLFENVTMVQFMHRLFAIINLINLLAYCYKIFNLDHSKKIAILLAVMISLQFILGVITLLLQAPLILALLHQALAIILMITIVISLKTRNLNVKDL